MKRKLPKNRLDLNKTREHHEINNKNEQIRD